MAQRVGVDSDGWLAQVVAAVLLSIILALMACAWLILMTATSDDSTTSLSKSPPPPPPPSPTAGDAPTVIVVSRFDRKVPHDPQAFTQGLVFSDDGRLFESVGLFERSAVRRLNPLTGAVESEQRIGKRMFGEGLAVVPSHMALKTDEEYLARGSVDVLVQLTWRNAVANIFRASDLALIASRKLPSRMREGWGVTWDSRRSLLLATDGSEGVFELDPRTFEVLRRVSVWESTRGGSRRSVMRLNELEWIDGLLYANVWHAHRIAVIRPADGEVVAWLDCSALVRADGSPHDTRNPEAVLNGIAYRNGELWLTGKLWDFIYIVRRPDELAYGSAAAAAAAATATADRGV